MDCNQAHTLLPLYFDGELDRAASREFEAHLDTCAECRAALIDLDTVRRSLRDDAPRYQAPLQLRERIANSANAVNANTPASIARRPARMTAWRNAAALALAFVVGGFATSLWNSHESTISTQQQIARDLFASHWRALAAASPVDVVSSDRHTVKPWFEGKVADAPLVRDFDDQGFALVGGRIDYVGSARVPVLVYRHGQHLIDVFVFADANVDVPNATTQQAGYRVDAIKLGDQNAAVVSDMDATEFSRFVVLLQSTK